MIYSVKKLYERLNAVLKWVNNMAVFVTFFVQIVRKICWNAV